MPTGDDGRVTLRRTRRPWFGPKRLLGWGWRVNSWQGRVVTAVLLGLVVLARTWWGSRAWPVIVGLLAVYLVVILLSGDRPGGPGIRPRGPGDRGPQDHRPGPGDDRRTGS